MTNEWIELDGYNYNLPKTLEFYLQKGLLIEYLMSLDDESLEEAKQYIVCDDIIGLRIPILLNIENELRTRKLNPIASKKITIKEQSRTLKNTLIIFLANNKLTDYLQTLTWNELLEAEMYLYYDDIVGEVIDIISAIRMEKEYREQYPSIPVKSKGSLSK